MDLKNNTTLDYKLKYKFYKDLEKIPLFKKSVEIVIKTYSIKRKKQWMHKIYGIMMKYYNMFCIY